MKSLSKKFKGIVFLFLRMKGGWRGGEGMPLHYRNPHLQGVSTTNERRKEETGFPFVRWKNTAGFSGFSHRMTSHWWESPGTGIAPRTCRGFGSNIGPIWLPYNNATLEMINNEIKTMERQATGYRDQKFFELQIPAMQGKSYAIVVWTLFSPPPSCAYMRARNIVMCLHILPVLSLSKSFRYVLL